MHSSVFFKFALILSGIGFLMDWYVYTGLKILLPPTRKRSWLLWSYIILSLVLTVLLITGISGFRGAHGMTPYHQWVLSLFLTFFVTKLVFVLVMFMGDLYRLVAGVIQIAKNQKQQHGGYIPSRRRFISEIAILIAAIPFSSFLYAIIRGKYDYKVHRHTLYFDDLPKAFDGFTITQLSDIHSGSFDNPKAVQRGIDLANAQGSDLFVFTGDLVNNGAWEIEPYLDRFNQLTAPFGQFSVLGNHDYGDYIEWKSPEAKQANLQKLKSHHKTLGYKLMMDENVTIQKEGEKIVLIGVENWGRGFIQKGDLDKALRGVNNDDFKILLSHDPTHWEEIIRYHPAHIHLTLSGHTHGAQFGVEAAGLRWSPVKYRYLNWAGLAVEKKRHLYVNRGFGFLAFSGRLGIWPEITVIELKRKA